MSLKGKRILVCPLDWGLGHASRSVVIVQKLLDFGAVPVIAADKDPLKLLQKEFPALEFITLKGVEIRYTSGFWMPFKMAWMLPRIFYAIQRENHQIQSIITNHKIDGVISDNRFGLYQKQVPSVYITHQLNIQGGNALFDYLLFKIHLYYIRKFDLCLVPDHEGEKALSGILSQKKAEHTNVRFGGILSRLKRPKESPSEFKYKVAVILSGPEPQRTHFEKMILNQLENCEYKVLFIRGVDSPLVTKLRNITMIGMADREQIQQAMNDSEIVLCRSGYSSIMDLVKMSKKAILVPTPGQTEQEYLAKYLMNKKFFYAETQHQFDINRSLQMIDSNIYLPPNENANDMLNPFFEEWSGYFIKTR